MIITLAPANGSNDNNIDNNDNNSVWSAAVFNAFKSNNDDFFFIYISLLSDTRPSKRSWTGHALRNENMFGVHQISLLDLKKKKKKKFFFKPLRTNRFHWNNVTERLWPDWRKIDCWTFLTNIFFVQVVWNFNLLQIFWWHSIPVLFSVFKRMERILFFFAHFLFSDDFENKSCIFRISFIFPVPECVI